MRSYEDRLASDCSHGNMDSMGTRIKTAATKQGEMDGMIDGTLRPFNCDPRGAFIKRPMLSEAEWTTYRNAYNKAFDEAVSK